jgi:hypothetical protein
MSVVMSDSEPQIQRFVVNTTPRDDKPNQNNPKNAPRLWEPEGNRDDETKEDCCNRQVVSDEEIMSGFYIDNHKRPSISSSVLQATMDSTNGEHREIITRWPSTRVSDERVTQFDLTFTVDAKKLADLIPTGQRDQYTPAVVCVNGKRMQNFFGKKHTMHQKNYDFAVDKIVVVAAQNTNTHSGFDLSLTCRSPSCDECPLGVETDFLQPTTCNVSGENPRMCSSYNLHENTSGSVNEAELFVADKSLVQSDGWQRWANQDIGKIKRDVHKLLSRKELYYEFMIPSDSATCVNDPLLCVLLRNLPTFIRDADALGLAYQDYTAETAFVHGDKPNMPVTVRIPTTQVDNAIDDIVASIRGSESLLRLSSLCVKFTPSAGWGPVKEWQKGRKDGMTPAYDHNPLTTLSATLRFVGRFLNPALPQFNEDGTIKMDDQGNMVMQQ